MSQAVERLTEDEIAVVKSAVARTSRQRVATVLGINQQTVIRVLSGEPVQRLTARLLRQHLAELPQITL